MGAILKVQGKRAIVFCVLSACVFAVMFSQTAYAAPASLPVTLTVEQEFTKPASSSAADAFTYKLTANEAGSPMPSGSSGGEYSFTIDGTDTVSVGPITYDHAGVYTYELKQVIAAEKTGYTYDKQVYTVKVYIKNGSAGLEQEILVAQKDDGSKVSGVKFTNAYAPLAADPALMVDPPVNKTVSGSPGKDSTFTFKLEAGDRSNPMPAGSVNGVKTLAIVGSGTEDFGTWSYTEAGTYYYTVSEVNTGESGYTYDTAVYTITDSVKDENGQLVLARTVTNTSNKQVSAFAFINKYTAASTGGTTDGPKTGDGAMTGLYQTLLGVGGVVLMACMLYLLMDGRRKKRTKFNM